MATITEQIILKVKTDTTQAASGLTALKKKIPPIEKSVKSLRNEIKRTSQSSAKEFNSLSKSFDAGGKRISSSLTKASKKTQTFNDRLKGLASGAAAGLVIAKLKQLGSEAITVSREFERIGLAMSTVFGAGAAEQMAFVEAEADRLGISVRTSAQGFSQLAASTKKILTLKETRDLFTATSEAAAALGLDAERTGGILRALSQIAGKGTVSAEELRQQIGEHLPGAFDLAAEAMGVTTRELNKMLEQGKLLSKDFLPKFAEQLKKTFHEGALNNASSEIAENARNLNLWEKQLTRGGNVLRSVLTPAIGGLLDVWEESTERISDAIVMVAELTGTLDAVAGATKKTTQETKKFTEELEKVPTAAEMVNEAMLTALDIVNKYQLAVSQAGRSDELRIELGLTEKGFSKISGAVDEMIKKGLSIKQMLGPVQQLIDQMKDTGAMTAGDDILLKAAADKAKKFAKFQENQAKAFEKFGVKDAGFLPFLDEDKKKKKIEQARLDSSRVPAAGIQTGTAEAAAFLVRPMKESEKIAKESLATQKKIEKNTAKAAENQVQVFGGGIN